MLSCERRYFSASHRVADQNGFGNLRFIDSMKDIVGQPLVVVTGGRPGGSPEATPGNAIHMTAVGELRRKLVIHVCGVARSGKQHNRSTSAAPVKHFELNVLIDRDELNRGLRRLLPWLLG